MKYVIKKILCIIGFIIVISGIIVGEYFIIKDTDEKYQSGIAENIYVDISTDFYLIKSSILAQNSEEYIRYLDDVNSQVQKLQQYSYIQNRDYEKIFRIQEYWQFLNEKMVLLQDFSNIKQYNDTILKFIEKEINDEIDDISKNEMQSLALQIDNLKSNKPSIEDENASKVLEKILTTLDFVRDSSNQLADCYDVCYADEIESKITSLQDGITSSINELSSVNDDIYYLFNIEKLDQITESINSKK